MCLKMVTCVLAIFVAVNLCVAFNISKFQFEEALPPREVRESISADCTMGSDRGPCRNNTVKWFYDTTHSCTRFWYGGCGGNGNRYDSKEECESVCVEPQGIARCNLAKVAGPCRGNYPRWYYDNTLHQCSQFVYGGCLGNNNRFEAYEECTLLCVKDYNIVYPPQLIEEEFQPELFAGDGDYIVLKCPAKGNPTPTITWSKENKFINGSEARFRILNGTLQILPLHKTDSGIYLCTADNKIGQPIQKQIMLGVLDSVEHPSRILNAEDSWIMEVSLGSTAILNCFAYGYPIPAVTWWKGDSFLPLKTNEFEVNEDNSLVIYAVERHNLGRYTCQAYNGFGKAAMWSVQLHGPVYIPNDIGAISIVEKCTNYCAKLQCPYGVEVNNDKDPLYKKCNCHDPCKQVICNEGSQCGVDLNLNRTSVDNTTFVAVCRGSKTGAKPGKCPEINPDNFLPDCNKECITDAECALDLICCSNGCISACLTPATTIKVPQQLVTTTHDYPVQTTSPLHEAVYPPQLIKEEFEPELFAGEGDYVTLKCSVKGNPTPIITWRKENMFIDGSEARFRILDGALQIVPLHKTDSGTYLCTASNKIGQPIRKKIILEVLESVDHPSRILNAEVSRNMVVSLGSTAVIDCFAYGYPMPAVTWWKEDNLLPLKSSEFAINKDNSLLINAVKLHNLGLYTCQAYNGYGKVAQLSVHVKTLGTVYSSNDNDTAARGHNYKSCSCQDTNYGCCPDNYTAAAGEDYNGCLCDTFQFGCCPDGVTIAKSPHKRGCDCRNTEFGCCSDNNSQAKGPNLEGCGCASTKYGCCLDETMEAKGENFQGCMENPGNLQAGCMLDLDKGTCKNYTMKWFYDTSDASCSSFWYSGCGGNSNKYNSKKECENVCVEPQGEARCNLVKLEGPCNEYYPKWYYDHTQNQCAQFIYGGCLGNNNRFEIYNECSLLCIKDSNIDTCSLPKVVGPCNAEYEQWYYDATTDLCEIFTYGGCLGNDNRFEDKYSCEKLCKRGTISDAKTPEGIIKQTSSTDISICDNTVNAGNCSGNILAYYYDAVTQKCSTFVYTGCGGNANRYNSEEECERHCGQFRGQDVCSLWKDEGSCGLHILKYYYNNTIGSCKQFVYGGCEGSGNRFSTIQECQSICVTREEKKPDKIFTVTVTANITLLGTKFSVGSDITITCEVDGYPTPDVRWHKNGEDLIQSKSNQVTGTHTLIIKNAKNSDSGEYSCEAFNAYSRATSSMQLRVDGETIHSDCQNNPFFANCKLIVNAQFCWHKYYAKFCCRSCTEAGLLPR